MGSDELLIPLPWANYQGTERSEELVEYLIQVLSQAKQILLLGEPGQGKTTIHVAKQHPPQESCTPPSRTAPSIQQNNRRIIPQPTGYQHNFVIKPIFSVAKLIRNYPESLNAPYSMLHEDSETTDNPIPRLRISG